MSSALQVNQALDRLADLADGPVAIDGQLSFEFEDVSISHLPRQERRDAGAESRAAYASSIWLAFTSGSLRPNEEALRRWSGKRVRVTGVLRRPAEHLGGCGHMSLWPAEVEPYSIEKINSHGEPE
jgi:hypothetical protein